MILEVMEYLKFVKKLEEIDDAEEKKTLDIEVVFDGNSDYMTNPFLTACKLNRIDTILKYSKLCSESGDNLMLNKLLMNNYEKISGDNCMMILCKNGYIESVVKILEFIKDGKLRYDLLAMQNRYNDETIMIEICKKEGNVEFVEKILKFVKDKELVNKLMNEKDLKGNCAIDYAKYGILNSFIVSK